MGIGGCLIVASFPLTVANFLNQHLWLPGSVKKCTFNTALLPLFSLIMKASWLCIPFLYLVLLSPPFSNIAIANKFKENSSQAELDSLNKLDSLVNRLRFSNTDLAKQYAFNALDYSNKINSSNAIARSYILLGIAYLPSSSDSSLIFYRKALEIANQVNNSEIRAHAYYCLASLYTEVCDYKTAVELLDSTLKYAVIKPNKRIVADAYNLLGNIRYDIQDVNQAKELYVKSFQISKTNGFYKQCGIALVNLAKLDKDFHDANKKILMAIDYFSRAVGCDEELASTYVNWGDKQHDPDSALKFLQKGLSLSIRGKLPMLEMGAYNSLAYCYLEKGDLRKAEICLIAKAIPLAVSLNNQDWLSTLYDSYADILIAKGDFKSAVSYEKKALNLKAQADQQYSSRHVRLLCSLLDLKQKELTIKVKEQELLKEKTTVQKTRFWLLITLFLLLIATTAVLWIRQRGRMKLQQEQINSARKIIELDEKEKSTIARDLHDLTGQMQVAFLGCVQNMKISDQVMVDHAQCQIQEVGNRMRRLSHRLNSNMIGHLGIAVLLTELCQDTEKMTGLKVALEIDEITSIYDSSVTIHLYRIIQEMMTNASKFVKEGNILLHLLVEENRILFSYNDSGPGFDPVMQEKGMGLMNIFERVKLLRGDTVLKSAIGKGTSWEISFPNWKNIKN